MRILVVRNDKIGDFMLAWPSFAMLKQSCDCEITALVPQYTAELANLCPWIDHVIVDPGKKGTPEQLKACFHEIKSSRFDATITLFSTTRIGWLLWKAKIPYRLAPATKFAQLFYNHRLTQRRSQSAKPEYQYNLDLIRAFLSAHQIQINEPNAPYLLFSKAIVSDVRNELVDSLNLDVHLPWVMVHCGSGGSANNLSISQYAQLIQGLYSSSQRKCQFVLTAGPGEELKTDELASLIAAENIPVCVFKSTKGLTHFAQVLANAALFIAGSTGPLHMASALDIPTVGFFPQRRSATPLRWRPLNSEGRHIAFSPPAGEISEQNMSLIDINYCVSGIIQWWDEIEKS